MTLPSSGISSACTSYLRNDTEHAGNSKAANAHDLWVDDRVDNRVGEKRTFSSLFSCCSCLVRSTSLGMRRREKNDENKTSCNSKNHTRRDNTV